MPWAESLECSFAEHDPVMLVESKGTPRSQWSFTSKGVTSVHDGFQRIVALKTGEVALPVFRALVGSHVGWCGQFWSPQVKKPKGIVNKDQLRATRYCKGWGFFPRGETERAGSLRRQGCSGGCHDCVGAQLFSALHT